MNEIIEKSARTVLDGGLLDAARAGELYEQGQDDFWDIVYYANIIREKYFGKRIKVCSIISARTGGCSEDCKFCAQSSKYKTHIGKTEYASDDEIIEAALLAKKNNIPTLGIVTSGQSISDKELDRLSAVIRKITGEIGVEVCCCFGILDENQAQRLADLGVSRYNHNLETSQRHFADIVSTHSFDSRVATIVNAQKAGMKICAGGIFGIGETKQDRIDMAITLRELGVDMVPMNFLHPIKGTPLESNKALSPREILTLIAVYRFILPNANLKIAGGRVLNLRDMQSWIFNAGASAIMSGAYLTTSGRNVEEDMQMISDLGLEPILTKEC